MLFPAVKVDEVAWPVVPVFTVQTVVGELLTQPLEANVASLLAGTVNVTKAFGTGLP